VFESGPGVWAIDEEAGSQGLAENTIIVFTSDHGNTRHSHGVRYNKMRPEAESIRVPLPIRYPGGWRPRNSEWPVGRLDPMPTPLGLMGIRPPDSRDGQNLAGEMKKARG
jgi:arylsulfatase A-like enzyme